MVTLHFVTFEGPVEKKKNLKIVIMHRKRSIHNAEPTRRLEKGLTRGKKTWKNNYIRHQDASKYDPTFDNNIGYIFHREDSSDCSQERYALLNE